MCGTVPAGGDPPSNGAPPRALFAASAAFIGVFIATFVLVMVLAFCSCRRRGGRTAPGGGGAPSGGPFPVENLPTFAYGRDCEGGGAAAAGGRECAVCLGAVREGEVVRRLPACMHVYHLECIDRWLAAHRTCPLCRSELGPCKVAAATPAAAPADPPDEVPV